MINHTLNAEKGELVITLPGDLLSSNADDISADISSLRNKQNGGSKLSTLTLDLTKARMIDSIGLNLLVGLVKDIQEQGGKLKALITSRTIHRTFLATRLDRSIEVVFQDSP